MINIGLHKKLVTSFDQSGTDQQEINNDIAHDGGIYIFDIDCLSDKSAAVTSSSDNCLSIYDTETLSQIRKIRAHTQMLNSFDLSQLVPHLAFSASNDHFIHGWDFRIAGDIPTVKIKLADEVTAISLGIADNLLAGGCGTSVVFYDLRNSGKKSHKLGEYSDVHTDTITQLRFSSVNPNMLASGAEDGLIGLYNTSVADGDEAIISILNTECPVRRIGYFGKDDEALFSLSTTETASFWHCATAQRVGDFQNIRTHLQADYLVDCMYDNNSDVLTIMSGDYDGGAKISVVEPTTLRVIGTLPSGGHSATIRCTKNYSSKTHSGMRIITGGEDSRLCSWNILSDPDVLSSDPSAASLNKNTHLKAGQGTAKKIERRQKPY